VKIVDQMQSSDEGDIIARCRKGDVDAFEVMVKMYQGKMFNIAYRIIGDADDAAEAVQDAFVAAYRNLHAFEQRSRFSTWLYAITVNTSRNRMSQVMARKARETHSLDDPATPDTVKAGREPASGEPSPLDQLTRKEQQAKIQECLNMLEPEFREVIVLRDIQGFAYEEIGTMLGLAAGTVKSRLFRARECVKTCLKKLMGDW
jgi:RNA polymerase sigma-70 factor (ECF subfamily)